MGIINGNCLVQVLILQRRTYWSWSTWTRLLHVYSCLNCLP